MKETESPPQLAQAAAEAARRGDGAGMLQAVFAGNMADWLLWRLRRLYPAVPAQDAQDCIATAIGDTYYALASGARIRTLASYLLKAASNNAVDWLRERQGERSHEMDSLPNASNSEIDDLKDVTRERLRRDALAKARELLPQLGMDNIRRVMEVIFDAIEHQIVDLRDSDIAIAVDLSEETVRRLKNRGFERMRRLAHEKGYDLTQYERAIGLTEILELDDESSDYDE